MLYSTIGYIKKRGFSMKNRTKMSIKAWILLLISFISMKNLKSHAYIEKNEPPKMIDIDEDREALVVSDVPEYYKKQLLDLGFEPFHPLKGLLDRCVTKIAVRNGEDLSWLKKSKPFDITFKFEEKPDKKVLEQIKDAGIPFINIDRGNLKLSELSYVFDTLDNIYDIEIDLYRQSDNLKQLSNYPNITYIKVRDIKDIELFSKMIDEISGLTNKNIWINLSDITFEDMLPLIGKIKDIDNFPSCSIYGDGWTFSKTKEESYFKLSYELIASYGGKFDVTKLPFDIKITFGEKPYDTAIFITKNDLDYIRDNNGFVDDEEAQILYSINAKIDEMMRDIAFKKDDCDINKLAKILLYITTNYYYDDFFEGKEDLTYEDVKSLYDGGYLYGIVNGEKKIICGNYAALVSAFLTRLGIENYMAYSWAHCWNIVKVDNSYYHVDATWLDDSKNTFANEFKNGVNSLLALLKYEWFLVSEDDLQKVDFMLYHSCEEEYLPYDFEEHRDYKLYNFLTGTREYFEKIKRLNPNKVLLLALEISIMLEIFYLYNELNKKRLYIKEGKTLKINPQNNKIS